MKEFLFKLLLGNHASSSTAGYLVLAFTVYQQLHEAGFDLKLALLGVGIFLVLRFVNESVPSIGPLLDEVLKLRKGVETVRQQTEPQGELIAGTLATVQPDLMIARMRERIAELEQERNAANADAETQIIALQHRDSSDVLREG